MAFREWLDGLVGRSSGRDPPSGAAHPCHLGRSARNPPRPGVRSADPKRRADAYREGMPPPAHVTAPARSRRLAVARAVGVVVLLVLVALDLLLSQTDYPTPATPWGWLLVDAAGFVALLLPVRWRPAWLTPQLRGCGGGQLRACRMIEP
jgi:hypothetical protein